jgi:hypothetical protein
MIYYFIQHKVHRVAGGKEILNDIKKGEEIKVTRFKQPFPSPDPNSLPPAYTKYAFFEWSLIIYDVAFDAVTALDFQRFEFTIQDLSAVHGHGDIDDDKHGFVE